MKKKNISLLKNIAKNICSKVQMSGTACRPALDVWKQSRIFLEDFGGKGLLNHARLLSILLRTVTDCLKKHH